MSCTPPGWIYYNETLHNGYLLNYISTYFFHTFNYKTCYRFQFTATLQQTYTYVYLSQYIIYCSADGDEMALKQVGVFRL